MEITKDTLIHYSRYLLRKLGHSMPPAPWIETFAWPGMQLSAFCKHCKKPFAIIGDPNVGKDGENAEHNRFYKKDWNLVEISTEKDYDTNRAWSSNQGPRVYKIPITTLGPRDFMPQSAIMNWLNQLVNPNQKIPVNDEGPDPDSVIRDKLKKIEAQFYCDKIRTWL